MNLNELSPAQFSALQAEIMAAATAFQKQTGKKSFSSDQRVRAVVETGVLAKPAAAASPPPAPAASSSVATKEDETGREFVFVVPENATAVQTNQTGLIVKGKEKFKTVTKACEEVFLAKAGLFAAALFGGGFFATTGVFLTGLYQLHQRVTSAKQTEQGLKSVFNAPLTKAEKLLLMRIGQVVGLSMVCNSILVAGFVSFLATGVVPRYMAVNRVVRVCAKPQFEALTDTSSMLTTARTVMNVAKHTSAAVMDPAGSASLRDEEFALPTQGIMETLVGKTLPTWKEFRENSSFRGFFVAEASSNVERPSFFSRLFNRQPVATAE